MKNDGELKQPGAFSLARLDPRVRIIVLFTASCLAQYLTGLEAAVWLALLSLLFLHREMRSAAAWSMLRGAFIFAAVWFTMLFAYLIWQNRGDVPKTINEALPMAGRLLALAVIGIAFSRLSPPVETGKAIAWFLRPFVGQRAWKAGLALALVAWFLPEALDMAAKVNASLTLRGVTLSWRKKAVLIPGTVLRIMEKQAAAMAISLASRRLDQDRVWRM